MDALILYTTFITTRITLWILLSADMLLNGHCYWLQNFNLERLILHLQLSLHWAAYLHIQSLFLLSCILSSSCLCSLFHKERLVFLSRSTGLVTPLITKCVMVLRFQGLDLLIWNQIAMSCSTKMRVITTKERLRTPSPLLEVVPTYNIGYTLVIPIATCVILFN
jgi:hypothetical protein